MFDLAFYGFAVSKPPEWANKLKVSWRKVNALSLLSACAVTILTAVLCRRLPLLPAAAAILSTSVVTYCLTQSVFTDFTLHLVDRQSLYAAAIVTFPLHLATAIRYDNELLYAPWAIVIIGFGALVFMPGIVGPSDGRALLLVSVSTYPIIESQFIQAFAFFIGSALVYILLRALYISCREKKLRTLKRELSGKKQHPMVPFILMPFLLVTIFSL
jgi:hypothetical protein